MSKAFDLRKQKLTQTVQDYAARSPVMELKDIIDWGVEWRCVVSFDTKTLAEDLGGEIIVDEGPIIVGIRYHERWLSEAPHPFAIATILAPANIFHPNIAYTGAACMGHPPAGFSLESVLNQLWAGLTLNLKVANTIPGDVANARAAEYVRTTAERYPFTRKGLFEEKDKS
jgi:hypothetical protein